MTAPPVVQPPAAARGLAALLALLAVIFAGGCASVESVAPVTVTTAVAMPCPTRVPTRPAFPADSLTGAEDLWTIGTTLWADRKLRQAYEIDIETRLKGCVEPVAERPP